jgi:hypothetical protein
MTVLSVELSKVTIHGTRLIKKNMLRNNAVVGIGKLTTAKKPVIFFS